MPWHPLLVHIPIAFAIFSPLLALYFAAYPGKRQAFWALWMLFFAGSAYASMAFGLDDAKTWRYHQAVSYTHLDPSRDFPRSVACECKSQKN